MFEKATYDDLTEDHRIRLERFKSMSESNIRKIIPIWITEDRMNEAQLIDFDRYTLINASSLNLINKAYLLELPTETLFNNDVNDFRYITTLERWESGKPVDPPTVYLESNQVIISDGRHRAILNYYLGQSIIPIVVLKSDSIKIHELLGN